MSQDIVSSIPVNETQVIISGDKELVNGKPIQHLDISKIWTSIEHTREAFKKNGFDLDGINEALSLNIGKNHGAQHFFSRLDQSKPLVITIETMSRIRAPEYYVDNGIERYQVKEFLTWSVKLNGLDYGAEPLECWLEHEGRCEFPIKKIRVTEDKYGKKKSEYVFSRETRHQYYVPFSRKVVDSLLEQTETDKDSIVYYAKFGEYPNAKTMKSRNNLYNYEQFVNSTWDELVSLDRRPGGPTGLAVNPILSNVTKK
jgi:hypothetical protein